MFSCKFAAYFSMDASGWLLLKIEKITERCDWKAQYSRSLGFIVKMVLTFIFFRNFLRRSPNFDRELFIYSCHLLTVSMYFTYTLRSTWDISAGTTVWKVYKYLVFSGPYFPVFGLKIWTRKNSVFGHFSRSEPFL